jgi:hypothetical protein
LASLLGRIILRMPKNILALLEGGDRRSIGRADEVVAAVSKNYGLFPMLMRGWRSEDPVVRMRVADATEKITRKQPDLLRIYKEEMLVLLAEAEQRELRWHLAAIIPRLPLNPEERQLASCSLRGYLQDGSSIVKTCALQALTDLAVEDASIRQEVLETLREATRNGTPAMKARSRKLLRQLDSDH